MVWIRFIRGPDDGTALNLDRESLDRTAETKGYHVIRDSAGTPEFDRLMCAKAVYVGPEQAGTEEA